MDGCRKVSCSFCHWGVQLILAYSWARPAVLAAAGKGRVELLLLLLFLHLLPFPSFFLIPLSSPLLSLLSLFSLSLGDNTKWPTRVDVSLNPKTIKCQALLSWEKFYSRLYSATNLLGTLWYWLKCWFSYFVLSAWIFAGWYQISWFFEVALIDSFFFFFLNFNKGFWLTDNFRQNIHFSVCLKLYKIPSVTREASSVLC